MTYSRLHRSIFWFMSMCLLTAAVIVFAGCAQTVTGGLRTAQMGLAGVDLATQQLAEIYVKAVELCEQNPMPICRRLGDAEVVISKFEALGAAYDSTAIALNETEKAWAEIAPHLEAAQELLKELASKQ